MTTFTPISNPSVSVGGIPSSTTVTALRDNPIAIAEGASGAPVMVSGWHPVDKVTIGDGKTGLIYDFAVHGAVASVVTPDFEDGYEYRIFGDALGSSGSSGNLQVEPYLQTSAIYDSGWNTIGVSANGQAFQFDVTVMLPRLTSINHLGAAIGYRDSTQVTGGFLVYDPTPQKLLRARVRFTVGNINAGKIYLYRRREFTTLP